MCEYMCSCKDYDDDGDYDFHTKIRRRIIIFSAELVSKGTVVQRRWESGKECLILSCS